MIIPKETTHIRMEKDGEGKAVVVFVGADGKEFNRAPACHDFWQTECILCDCSSHALIIMVMDDDDDDDMAYLSIFDVGHEMPRTFRQLIRQAWRLLRTGLPYGDQLCFSTRKLEALRSAADRAIAVLKGRKPVGKDESPAAEKK